MTTAIPMAHPAAAGSSRPVALLLLLAVAVLVGGGGRPGRGRLRGLGRTAAAPAGPEPVLRRSWLAAGTLAVAVLVGMVAGPGPGLVAGGAAGLAAGFAARRLTGGERTESGAGELAGCWELLAVCLTAGLPVAAAVAAATEPLTGPIGLRLRRVAGLLALGADPAGAWAGSADLPALATLARAAGRSAGTGAALAHVARAEAGRMRAELMDSAQARAQRAAVLITGPLGLCFLPAFLVLGITPVVIGLATDVLTQW